MSRKQILAIIALTLTYLCFELAFNARLLDVVGGTATSDQIHHIEIYGRSLSGAAVGLLVLQWLLGRRQASGSQRSPGGMTILLAVAASGALTYASLQVLVDGLVARSEPAFRRASLNIVLVQHALVEGQVELDGLTDDRGLFRQPAGKAFLAQFPVMATSIDRLDEKIRDAKLTLISTQVANRLGQASGFYRDAYVKAVQTTQEKWQRYSKAPTTQNLEGEIARQQDKAWSDYLRDLGRRGWTPSTVPGSARGVVLRKVRARVPVPTSWDLADEATFREAVATKVRKRAGSATGPKGLTVHGQKLPPGLSWTAFFAHPGIQAELRDQLHLPAGIGLQPSYSSGAEFQHEVFDPMVKRLAREELARYDAPVEDFADGAKLAERGRDAARLAIVPPLALFFSLLGAMTHLGKLCYLAVKGLLAWKPHLGERVRHVWPVLVGVVLLIWVSLSWTENAVTRSRLYAYMTQQIHDSAEPVWSSRLMKRAITNGLHVVAVGQDLGYPLFEGIRTQLLGGITYGYQDSHP